MTLNKPSSENNFQTENTAHMPGVRAFTPVDAGDPFRNFEFLLSSFLDVPNIVYMPGDEKNFRQAVAAPIVGSVTATHVIQPRVGNLLNLLIERENGQLLVLCILGNVEHQIILNQFMQKINTALPKSGAGMLDTLALEESLSKAVGCTITLEEVSLENQISGFYSNATEGLAQSILKQATTQARLVLSVADRDSALGRVIDCLKKQLDRALNRFSSRLDERIRSVIHRSGAELTTSLYNQYCGLGKAIRDRRLQAAEAFPLIGAMQMEYDRKYAYLRRAVDRKMPLTPALSKGLGVPLELVRWLMGKDIDCVGHSWAGRLNELAKCLSLVCPEHRPVTRQDWTAFADFASAVDQLDKRSTQGPFVEKVDITAGLMRQIGKIGWTQARMRLEALGAIVSDLTDISDFLEEIIHLLAEQIGESGPLADILHDELAPPLKRLYFSVGLKRQIMASLRWHQLMLEPEVGLGVESRIAPITLDAWRAPFDGFMEVDGVVAVCLTNPQQLIDESKQMQHCVRNYADYCLYYGSTIVSLRAPDGTRLSTVELNLTGNPSGHLRFVVRQHRGFKNAQAPQEAINVLPILLSLLNATDAAAKRQQLFREQNERKAFRRDRTSLAFEPRRIELIKQSLQLHVGYENFYDEAMKVAGRL